MTTTTALPERSDDPPTVPPGSSVPSDDHDLIAASLRQPELFAAIFDRHAGTLHRFLSRRLGSLADDLLGEVFVVAFERRGGYRAELADARPWLFGIAANLVRQHHRAEAARYRALGRLPQPEETADGSDAVVDVVDAAALRPRLAAALAMLRPDDRDVLLLLAWAQLDQSEVAAATGVPVGTVRSRLHRARHQLRPVLDDLQETLR